MEEDPCHSPGQRSEISGPSCASLANKPNAVAQKIGVVIDAHLTKSRQRPVKTRLQVFVRSQSFEMFFAMVVLANAILVGVRADTDSDGTGSLAFDVLELLVAMLFFVELCFRMAASGMGYWKGRAGFWNFCDALLIVFMFVDAACALGGIFMFGVDDGGLMRLYRVLRLVRVARMARLFQLVPELNFTLSLMLQSLSSFFWAAVLMMLLLYLVALYFTIVSDQFVEAGSVAAVQAYWGSTGSSMNSLFLAVFGGEDWHNMLLVFGQGSGWYIINSMVLALFVGFVLVVMLNLVNGVLVEGAQEMIADMKRDELVRMAADIFVQTGKQAGSELSKAEFDQLVTTEAMEKYLMAIGLEIGEADDLFQFLDRDDSGSLSIVEFVQGCLRLRGPAKALDLAEMRLWSKERNVENQTRMAGIQQRLYELGLERRSFRGKDSEDLSPLPPVGEDLPPEVLPRQSPNLTMMKPLSPLCSPLGSRFN
ncbi:unnamed protein product [Effrenium voratum]|nr:unnamed protein product [Effrenium voratum]